MNYLSVDVEEDFPPHMGTLNGVEGLRKIAGLLAEHNSEATFFITAEILDELPDIADIVRGHEVGCHGLRHIDYSRMPKERFEEETLKAIDTLNSHGLEPVGFRAPYASINGGMLEVVGRHFRYDSSKRFYNPRPAGVREIPIYAGGKAFGINPIIFNIIRSAPIRCKVYFIHPWEYGGLDFNKISSRRRGMRLLGYSSGNYVENLAGLLKEGCVSISNLL
ncbi:MAG: polysaccharide deacetylase family protein [Candidatus Altiarchaeota archaeon]